MHKPLSLVLAVTSLALPCVVTAAGCNSTEQAEEDVGQAVGALDPACETATRDDVKTPSTTCGVPTLSESGTAGYGVHCADRWLVGWGSTTDGDRLTVDWDDVPPDEADCPYMHLVLDQFWQDSGNTWHSQTASWHGSWNSTTTSCEFDADSGTQSVTVPAAQKVRSAVAAYREICLPTCGFTYYKVKAGAWTLPPGCIM